METNKIKLPVPAEGQLNWYNIFVNFAEKIDVFLYEGYCLNSLIPAFEITGADPLMYWDVDNERLVWVENTIVWYNVYNNQKIILDGNYVVVPEEAFVYIMLNESNENQIRVQALTGSKIDVRSNILVLGKRVGDEFYINPRVVGKTI